MPSPSPNSNLVIYFISIFIGKWTGSYIYTAFLFDFIQRVVHIFTHTLIKALFSMSKCFLANIIHTVWFLMKASAGILFPFGTKTRAATPNLLIRRWPAFSHPWAKGTQCLGICVISTSVKGYSFCLSHCNIVLKNVIVYFLLHCAV